MSLFDQESWRERMDERWFDTGVAMAEKGDVDLVAIEDEKVTAHVTGSVGDLYVVELRAPNGEGSCTCPGCSWSSPRRPAIRAQPFAPPVKFHEARCRLGTR